MTPAKPHPELERIMREYVASLQDEVADAAKILATKQQQLTRARYNLEHYTNTGKTNRQTVITG